MAEVDPGEEPVLSDVTSRKYSADIEALGARKWFDYRVESGSPQCLVRRAFLLPEDSVYLIFGLVQPEGKVQVFPAQPVLIIQAYFADGHRLVVSNSGFAFRKQLDRNATARYLSKDRRPEEFLKDGRRILKRLTTEEGRRLRPPMSKEEYILYYERQHEETRRRLADYGYFSWADAFRKVFGLRRPEYEEPG